MYDKILAELEAKNEVVTLGYAEGDEHAYPATNESILEEASSLGQKVIALVVWEGESRGPGDYTEHFSGEAGERGIPVHSVPTRDASNVS